MSVALATILAPGSLKMAIEARQHGINAWLIYRKPGILRYPVKIGSVKKTTVTRAGSNVAIFTAYDIQGHAIGPFSTLPKAAAKVEAKAA
jgi:hypothetical protein